MDIVQKRGSVGGQGNAAGTYSSSLLRRACDWQYGADALYNDIEAEKTEEDNQFGVVNYTKPVKGA